MSLQKKYPPYSKPLRELIEKGYRPANDVMVIIGNKAWQKADKLSISYPDRIICIPPWQSPHDFYFPVKECDILIIDTGYAEEDYLNDLVVCLYDSDVALVRIILPDYTLTVYHKDSCHA